MAQVAQGIGALGTVAAVYFLVRQTKALTDQTAAVRRTEERTNALAQATGYATVGQMMLQVDALFAQHPDLRGYVYGDLPMPPSGTEEHQRARLAAETILDVLDVYSQQSAVLGRSAEASWHAFAQDVYRSSEAVRHYWSDSAHWYPVELRAVFREAAVEGS